MNAALLTGGLIILLLAMAGTGAWIVWRRRAGMQWQIDKTIGAISTEVLRDVVIPDGMGGQIHLDYLLLTTNGLLVLDIKDLVGNIFGSNRMDEWTVINGKDRFTFRNPQSSLYDRVAAVKLLAQEVPVRGRIVFTPRGSFSKGVPDNVTMLSTLLEEFAKPGTEETRTVMDAFYPYWERLQRAALPDSHSLLKK